MRGSSKTQIVRNAEFAMPRVAATDAGHEHGLLSRTVREPEHIRLSIARRVPTSLPRKMAVGSDRIFSLYDLAAT